MKKNNKKGFTIVELVIVIAVIAILAAVLIPTFSGVVEKANESAALQEAKNQYTLYLTETAPENATEGYVVISKSGDTYYFQFKDSQLDTKNVLKEKPNASENNEYQVSSKNSSVFELVKKAQTPSTAA